MSRYKHQSRTFILRFEDLPGLEVVMRPVLVGRLMDMAALADGMRTGAGDEAATLELFRLFASRLVSWNLDGEDDEPVAADLEGVRSLDADMFMQIFEGWFEGMTRAPKGPPKISPNGVPEAGLPMQPLGM